MAELKEYLSNIAEAIRTKKGTTEKINAQDFASEIKSIESSINPVEISTTEEMLAETNGSNLGAVFKYVGATGAYTQGEYYKVVQVEAVHIPYLGYPYYVIMYEPSNNGFRIVWRATSDLNTSGYSWYNDGLVSGGVSRWNYYVDISGSRYISSIYSTLPEAVTAIQSVDTTYTYTEDNSTYIYKNGSTAIYNDTLVFYSNFSGEITYSDDDDTTTFTENPLLTDSYSTIRIYSPIFETKTVKPTTQKQSIYPSANYDGLSQVTVNPVTSSIDSNIKAENIKSGVDILGVTGSLETGITPSGTISITNNGTYNVTNYASAEVSVEAQSSGLSINGIIEQYKVEAGETVNAGDFVEFVTKYVNDTFASVAQYPDIAVLSTTKLVVSYIETTPKVAIFELSGNTITITTSDISTSTIYTFTRVCAISETLFVIMYGQNSGYPSLGLFSVEGGKITRKATCVMNKYIGITTNSALKSLYFPTMAYSNGVLLCAHTTNSSDGDFSIGSYLVTNETLTHSQSSSFSVSSDDGYSGDICFLNKDIAISINYDNGAAKTILRVYAVSSTGAFNSIHTISNFGSTSVIYGRTYNIARINDSQAIVSFNETSTSILNLVVITYNALSGTISVAEKISLSKTSRYNVSLMVIRDNLAVVADNQWAIPITINDTMLVEGAALSLGGSASQSVVPSAVAISNNSFAIVISNAYTFFNVSDNGEITKIDSTTDNGVLVRLATSNRYNVGIAKTSGVGGETIDVYRVPKIVSVTLNLTNVTSTQYSTSMSQLETQTITITANEGYLLPETIVVSGVDYTWNSSTGVLVISNPTSNVNISITGQQITLSAPTITIIDDTLTITDTSGLATSYDILVDGVAQTTISLTTFDMTILGLSGGTYSITVVAKADGYGASVESNAISYVVEQASGSSFELMTVTLSGSGSSQVAVLSGLDTSKIYSIWINGEINYVDHSSTVYQLSYSGGKWATDAPFGINSQTSTSVNFSGYTGSGGYYDGTSYENITVLEGDELATLGVITGYDTSGTFPIHDWPCYAKGTQITLADGSTKNVEDITYSDELLVWDFDKGDYATAKPLWIKKAETATYYYNIKFESGDDIKLIGSNGNCHRLFSIEDGEFVYANKLVGKEVYTQFGADKVVSCEVVNEPVEFYNIITDYHINCFANEVLTSCRYNNIYPISNMKFVKDDRDVVPFEAYDVPIEYYNGMRLGEQTIDIEKTNKYIAKLIKGKDEK